jgi:excisionase family DNA binding protein
VSVPAHLPVMTPLAEPARSGLERLLSIDELSEYLRVPVTTLYDWRANQKGPLAIRVGRALRYPESAVREWLDAEIQRELATSRRPGKQR